MTRDARRDAAVFLGHAVLAGLAALVVLSVAPAPLQRYFGPLPPLAAIGLAAAAGFGALLWLHRASAVAASTPLPWARLGLLATLFAAAMIVIDLARPFPSDINVALPLGLAFYLTMALVAESLFHLVPLALLFAFASRLGARRHTFWLAAAPVALIEAGFQIVFGSGPDPGARDAVMGLHLTLFAAVQLAAFRRYGYGAMVGLRLVYYLWWHLAWGTARLPLLF